MRTLLMTMALCAACATGGAHYGSVSFRPARAYGSRPASFSVGPRQISGTLANATLDDKCVRGTMGNLPLNLCDEGNGHWAGSSGDLQVGVQGNSVVANGYLLVDSRRRIELVNESIPLGEGPQWDELRRAPVLAAIASTAADLSAPFQETRRGY